MKPPYLKTANKIRRSKGRHVTLNVQIATEQVKQQLLHTMELVSKTIKGSPTNPFPKIVYVNLFLGHLNMLDLIESALKLNEQYIKSEDTRRICDKELVEAKANFQATNKQFIETYYD